MSSDFYKNCPFPFQRMEACKQPVRCERMSSALTHRSALLNLGEGRSPLVWQRQGGNTRFTIFQKTSPDRESRRIWLGAKYHFVLHCQGAGRDNLLHRCLFFSRSQGEQAVKKLKCWGRLATAYF